MNNLFRSIMLLPILGLALASTLHAQATDSKTQPKALWRFATEGSLWANPVTDGTTLWFGSDDHHFYALDTTTGEQRWKFATGGRIRSQAALGEKRVFFSSDDGNLYALDRASGALQYQVLLDAEAKPRKLLAYEADNPFDWRGGTPLLDKERLFVGSGDGRLVALDANSGKLLWEFKTGGPVRSRPALHNGTLVVGSWDGKVYALNAATGAEQWRYDTGGVVLSDIEIWQQLALVGSRSASLYALDVTSGKLAWQYSHESGSWVESSPTLVNDQLFIGSSDALRLLCLDPASGKQLWDRETGGWSWATPAVHEGEVFIGTMAVSPHQREPMAQGLQAVNAETGAGHWFLPSELIEGYVTGGVVTRPLVVDGRLLVADLDGTLRAFTLP